MIIDSLPHLIQLIKQNNILHSLVLTGDWQSIELKAYNYDVMGQTLVIKDFALSPVDKFEVNFSVKQDISEEHKGKMISLSLISHDSKYFDAADYYFGDDANRGKNKNPLVKAEREFKKDLGVFKIYEDAISPAFVTITHNPAYGYLIYIRFYTNFEAAYKIKKQIDDTLEQNAELL